MSVYRTASQNVLFRGESPGDNEYEPAGASIARRIEHGLQQKGFTPSAIENWRDCGWSIDILAGEAELQVAVACTAEPGLWLLQVACINDAGMLARLFGKSFIDRSAEVLAVASAVHEILRTGGFTGIRWRVDGYPDDAKSTPEPIGREYTAT